MPKKKTLSKLKQDLQKVFNKYIRERDKELPCVSCGQYKTLQAGHYFAVSGYDGLRFDEDNVHGECARCNCWDESHLILYGENLKARIGEERYLALCDRAKAYKMDNSFRWDRAELEELRILYLEKCSELE